MRRFNIPPSMQGYEVKDGRLINMAPSPEMGITKLAQMRASAKRYEKVQEVRLDFPLFQKHNNSVRLQ